MDWPAEATRAGMAALGVIALALAVATVASARRPSTAVAGLDGFVQRWSQVHGGYDPSHSVWVRGWLAGVYRLARPLARLGVNPNVLTAWTAWLAMAVLLAAAAGGRWRMLAGWLLVVSGLFDSLDGAVAVLTHRTSRWGYVLDSMVDRLNEIIFVAAVVVVGAPPALGVACGAMVVLLEYLRARGSNAGGGDIGTITVGERPNRVALCAVGIHFSGVFLDSAPAIATASLGLLTILSLAGLAQLLVAVRRQLI